jgi:hypothetical protein
MSPPRQYPRGIWLALRQSVLGQMACEISQEVERPRSPIPHESVSAAPWKVLGHHRRETLTLRNVITRDRRHPELLRHS